MNKLLLAYTAFTVMLLVSFKKQADAQTVSNSASIQPSPQIESYNNLISRYRYDKPDTALFLAYKGLDYAKVHGDLPGKALLLNQLGMINDNRGKFEEATLNYSEALSIYRLLGQHKGMATETIRLGVVEMRKGNYSIATDLFLKALKTSEIINDDKGIMEANITLAEAYTGQQKYQLALRYLKIAEGINDTLPFSNLSLNLYNDYGVAYIAIGNMADAKAYLNIGISRSKAPQYQGLNITLTNTLAKAYAKEGDIVTCIELQQIALHKAQAIQNYLRELQTLMGLARTYKTCNTDTSLMYLFKAKALAQSKAAHKQVIEALQQIAGIYTQKGDYKAALEAKNEQYELANEHYYKAMSKQIASLQASYELSKSKVQIQQLSIENSRQMFKHRIVMAIAAAVSLLLLITAGFYYRTGKLNMLLKKTNTRLDESNQTKDKLFSILGHDLRTPFISVINLLSFVDDEDLPADSRKELITQLSLTTKASLETLDSLLKWGEMQIKGIRLSKIEFVAKPIVDRIIYMMQGAASYKSITLFNEVDASVKVYADINHFEFIIRNLLSNAIKFTGTGGKIVVSAKTNTACRNVILSVEDNGVGIHPDKLHSIFTPENVSSNGTNNEKGTSLGLLMCKEFMIINEGRIFAESERGKGSRFNVEFKNKTADEHRKRRRFRFKLFKSAQL